MALESIQNKVFTTKTDVWSFGVTCWEILTKGRHPYADMPNSDLFDFLNDGRRLAEVAGVPDELNSLMKSCWSKDPNDRPTFVELVQSLSTVVTHSYGNYTSSIRFD